MYEILSKLDAKGLAAVLLLGGFLVACIVGGLIAFLAYQWRLHRRSQTELALKQDMLNRGMSVDEIERVLNAFHPTTEMDRLLRLAQAEEKSGRDAVVPRDMVAHPPPHVGRQDVTGPDAVSPHSAVSNRD